MKKKKIPYQSPVVCDLSGTGEAAGGGPLPNDCSNGACGPGSGVTPEIIETAACNPVGMAPTGSCVPGDSPTVVWCYCGNGGYVSIG